MRISDRYIGKQVFIGTLSAIAVLSLVLVLGNIFQKIRELLVDQVAPLGLIGRFVLSVLPASLIYTIPWGFLSAVLLVFGRLSSDREITGFRVAGVSLARLAAPVFAIGALLSAASLWLNMNVVPAGKVPVRELIAQEVFNQAVTNPESLLKPGVAQADLENDNGKMQLLIEGKKDGWVNGFHLYQLDPGRGTRTYVHAHRAALSVDRENSQLRVKLENTYFETPKSSGEMEIALAGNAEPLLIDLESPKSRRVRPGTMTNGEIRSYLANHPDLEPHKQVEARAEITKRYSFSMACLAFAFIAVPLGINSRRKDTSSGLILSLLLGAGYFLFTVLAGEAETDAMSTLVLWTPNVVCVLLGLFLFRRARFK